MEMLLAHCSHLIADHGNIFASLAVAGLVGSLTHCSSMCGPLVAAQMAYMKDSSSSSHRSLLWYHAGRLTTYALLGAVAAGSAHLLFGSRWFPALSGFLLLAAGGLFLLSALKPRATHACHCGEIPLLRHLRAWPASTQFYVRGFLLGFMPCGLVVAALLMVATVEHPAVGAAAMLLFGLTTAPVLQMIGYGAHRITLRWKPAMSMIGRGAMTVNGLVLCAAGMHAL